ncbi:RING-type E3 ubiquitin transferase [Sarracenia purpurea var. burkii]
MPELWLPPLNSHDAYTIHVSAQQFHMRDANQYSPAAAEFSIKLNVSVDFRSSDLSVRRSIQGLSVWNSLRHPCDSITSDAVSHLISPVFIPFPLDRLRWRARGLDGLESTRNLDGEQDVKSAFLDFLRRTRAAPYNAGRRTLPVKLTIEKVITLPAQEFEVWTSWYEEQRILDSTFVRDYAEAIGRPRRGSELANQEVLMFRSAWAETAVVEVCLEGGGGDSTELCSICLEEMAIGSRVARLPCSHLYHGNCVLRWLKSSNVCPLCRYALPAV